MIKQHQRQLNQLNGALDALSAFAAMMLAFVIRFYLRDDGAIAYGVASHVLVALGSAALHLVVYSAMGFYKTHRSMRYYAEIWQIVVAESLCFTPQTIATPWTWTRWPLFWKRTMTLNMPLWSTATRPAVCSTTSPASALC